MATGKTPTVPKESPEQLALAEATAEVTQRETARRDAVGKLEQIHRLTTQQTEFTSRVLSETIQQVPGTRIGRLVAEGLPPTPTPTASRADLARARLARVGAEDAVIVAEADLLDAQRSLADAQQALARRQLTDALPQLTADTDALLTEVETLTAKAETVFKSHVQPLLAGNPLAAAVQECRLFELDMLRDRAPRLRAVLAALTDQYLPSNGGGH